MKFRKLTPLFHKIIKFTKENPKRIKNKGKQIIQFLILLVSIQLSAQKIVICDSLTNNGLSFSTIQLSKTQKGEYTNEEGVFKIPENWFKESVAIEISQIGFFSKKVLLSNLRDTIFLKQKEEVLEVVEIISGKYKKKEVGFRKKRKFLTLHTPPKSQISTLVKYKKSYKSIIIDEISIPISKSTTKKKGKKYITEYPKFKSSFRIHICSNLNGKPDKDLIKPILIKCNENSKKTIVIDLKDEFIKLPIEGVFIGVETIQNKKGLPAFKFTNKKDRRLKFLSLIKFIFTKKGWQTSHDFFSDYTISKKEYKMALGLKLRILE